MGEARRRREDVFGTTSGTASGTSADERDDADRARRDGERDRRWYEGERPPHHDR